MPLILGIESTCDETGAAVVRDGREVLSNVVASQVELHAVYRGVVPEIASRAHIENILPVIRQALDRAGVGLEALDAIAVAHRPGLIGSLLIGVTAAKTLAWATGRPLIAVDHVQAHLYSVMLDQGPAPAFPAVGLVASGGHTALYDLRSFSHIVQIGATLDDAVGEAYDKVAAILGLGYPGGPIIDRLAMEAAIHTLPRPAEGAGTAQGQAGTVRFPRSLLDKHSLDFSFSGLKTSVLYHVRGVPSKGESSRDASTRPPPSQAEIRQIAWAFQQACVDTLLEKLRRAIARTLAKSVIIGGGVSANHGLRAAVASLGLPVHLPQLAYCTDNAAMIAGLADVLFGDGRVVDLTLDAVTSSSIAREV
jgi:N6-L-threonylcarbamoyladenine synthase